LNAVSFLPSQGLGAKNKADALSNISGVGYIENQGLRVEDKERARANIGACS